MTTQPGRRHDREPGPAGSPRRSSDPAPSGDESAADASRADQDSPSGRLACSLDERIVVSRDDAGPRGKHQLFH